MRICPSIKLFSHHLFFPSLWVIGISHRIYRWFRYLTLKLVPYSLILTFCSLWFVITALTSSNKTKKIKNGVWTVFLSTDVKLVRGRTVKILRACHFASTMSTRRKKMIQVHMIFWVLPPLCRRLDSNILKQSEVSAITHNTP